MALRKGQLMLTGRSRRGRFTKEEALRVWAELEKGQEKASWGGRAAREVS